METPTEKLLQPFKILVVDDEPDVERLVRQRMRRDIRSGRYSFVFAGNGIEALDVLAQSQDIDMVLSDINMPQMDGLTLLGQIPSVNPNIRAVIVSAYGDMKNIRTAMNRGAFDFITKPIDFDDMRITIERTLRNLAIWREALSSRDKLVALERELGIARQMQLSILPTRFPVAAGYEVFANMQPARAVGGDFYDVLQLEAGRIGLAIADVSDKGVPAALFMMSSRTLLRGAAIGCRDPGDVLKEVNNMLVSNNESMMFVTVFYAIFDPVNGTLTYANGGHNEPLLVHADGSSELLPPTGGVAAGVMSDFQYNSGSVRLSAGDAVVLYTDGVTEAMNPNDEEYGVEQLLRLFAEGPRSSAKQTNEAVFQAVSEFAEGTAQSDDITCLTLHYKGAAA